MNNLLAYTFFTLSYYRTHNIIIYLVLQIGNLVSKFKNILYYAFNKSSLGFLNELELYEQYR